MRSNFLWGLTSLGPYVLRSSTPLLSTFNLFNTAQTLYNTASPLPSPYSQPAIGGAGAPPADELSESATLELTVRFKKLILANRDKEDDLDIIQISQIASGLRRDVGEIISLLERERSESAVIEQLLSAEDGDGLDKLLGLLDSGAITLSEEILDHYGVSQAEIYIIIDNIQHNIELAAVEDVSWGLPAAGKTWDDDLE